MSSRRKIRRVGITTRKEMKSEQNRKVLENLIHCLEQSKKEVFLSRKARSNLLMDHPEARNIHDLPKSEKLDLLIVLGGDGSILNAVRKLPHLDTYVFGINIGNIGFLSEVSPDNLENTCLTLWDANYTIDERMLLKIQVYRNQKKIREYTALNDVVISQAAVARLVELPTKVDDNELTTFRADGLIIATPTGSTAYNLSAGGPILYPRIEAMILTPIAPFSLSQKPLVIPANKTVSVFIKEYNEEEIMISIDGQIHEPLQCGDVIKISKHPKKLKFLRLPEESYFKTLRGKLKWGERL